MGADLLSEDEALRAGVARRAPGLGATLPPLTLTSTQNPGSSVSTLLVNYTGPRLGWETADSGVGLSATGVLGSALCPG